MYLILEELIVREREEIQEETESIYILDCISKMSEIEL